VAAALSEKSVTVGELRWHPRYFAISARRLSGCCSRYCSVSGTENYDPNRVRPEAIRLNNDVSMLNPNDTGIGVWIKWEKTNDKSLPHPVPASSK